MYTATSNTRQEVLGDITKVQGEFCWHEGGGTFSGRWYLTGALKDNRKKRIQGGPSGVDHRNDGRKLGLGMPRSSENGGVYRECRGGWGLWEMRQEASAERRGVECWARVLQF